MTALPAAVVAAFRSGDQDAAGELLRAHGEALTRAEPRRGRAWAEAVLAEEQGWPPLQPWIEWAAGTVLHLCGEAGRAEPLLASAVRRFSARRRRDLADRVGLLLLDLYAERLELPRARRLAGRLVERFATAGDRRRVGVTLANLGNAEDAADRVGQATRLWRRARQEFGEGDLDALLVLGNLGNAAALAGRFDEAVDAHRRVAALAERLGHTALVIQAELNTAGAEFVLGRVDDALRRWQATVERAAEAGDPLLEAVARIDLAEAEMALGRVEHARRRLETVVPDLERLGLVLELARSWRLLAVCEASVSCRGGRHRDEARSRLGRPGLGAQRDLLEVDLAMLDPGSDPGLVRAAARRLLRRGLKQRGMLGLAWAAVRFADAGASRAAMALAREVLGRRRLSPWVRMTAHHAAARGLVEDPGAALRHARMAARAAGRLHVRLHAAADRSAFLSARGEVFLDLVWRLVERGRAQDLRQCLELLSTSKAGWLVAELSRRADRGGDELVRRWQELSRRLAALVERTEGEDEPRVRRLGGVVHHQLRQLEDELEELETRLDRNRPGLVNGPGDAREARTLPAKLPKGHVYVEYLLDRGDLLVLVAGGGRLRVERCPSVGDDVRRLAASIRFHQDTHTWRSAADRAVGERSLSRRLEALGAILLDALPEDGWSVLWVAPDSVLYHIPWAALPDGNGRALIDRGGLTMVPGARLAAEMLGSDSAAPSSSAVVGAGSAELALVQSEIRSLAELLPGAVTAVEATRRQVLAALAERQVVHVAAHALFLDGVPGAAGIRLADGFLTLHDLAAAAIRARLVSFGTCSGVRVEEADGRRFEGFLRVLLTAGVRHVVGPTGWVLDTCAHRFAVSFFTDLERAQHPALAFGTAVRAVRELDPHPAAWGSFQLYGDGRKWRAS